MIKINITLRKRLLGAAIAVLLVFAAFPGTVSAQSCLSWLWGGDNQETTYSAPYVPGNSAIASQNIRPGYDQPAYPVLGAPGGQGVILGQTVAPASGTPSTTVVRTSTLPRPCAVSGAAPVNINTVSYPSSTTYQPVTVYQPEVKSGWSYSRIESTNYRPVQVVDAQTGYLSSGYVKEDSKSLLPWLHQKETVSYKPVMLNVPVATPITISRPVYTAPPVEVMDTIPVESATTYKPIIDNDIDDSVSVSRSFMRIVDQSEPLVEIPRSIPPDTVKVERLVPPNPQIEPARPQEDVNVKSEPIPLYRPQERKVKIPKVRNVVPSAFISERIDTPENELKPAPVTEIDSKVESTRIMDSPQTTSPTFLREKRGSVSLKRTPPPPAYYGPLDNQMNKNFPSGSGAK